MKKFKTPDGKEFDSRSEWRDYMMKTFYSYKDRRNESEPLIKEPGSIDGQMFDIGDCENTTMIILDHCEQVQIDQIKNCKVFLGAGASSVFIRNCENCTFYVCCRQLRLREVINSKFYTFTQSEIHIEYSNGLKFGPFLGGYPEHAKHLANAHLDVSKNLWYDVYDHNDPAKSRVNWSLIPESEYDAPWFPKGPCEQAVPITVIGSVEKKVDGVNSFDLAQMQADAQKLVNLDASVPPPIPPPSAADLKPQAVPPSTAPEKKVAILGTGDVGATLSARLLASGWQVKFGSRHPDSDKVKKLLAEQPGATVATFQEASKWANAIIIATPGMRTQEEVNAFAVSLGDGVEGKVLLDVTNPLSGFPGLEILWSGNTSGGELFAAAFTKSAVFKALNTIGKIHMAFPDGSKIPGYDTTKGPLANLFAGPKEREADAAAVIAGVGFRPVYVGPIRYSRNLEAIAELWIHLAIPPVGFTQENWGPEFIFGPIGH